jgi:hypothetical protein
MFALNVAILLLAAPVLSQPEVQERQLWWNSFWNTTTKIFTDVTDKAMDVWDHLGFDQHFPKIDEALDNIIEQTKDVFIDLRGGLETFWGHATDFWKGIVEGVNKNKTPVENVMNIIRNSDQFFDCDTNTYEILIDVICGVDKVALLQEIKAIAASKLGDQIDNITLAEQEPCNDDMQFQPVEVEFDIAADKESFITDFKEKLANWKPSEEPALATYLAAQQPDGAVSTELTFCEAYNSGATEFQIASDSIKTLAEEIEELIKAAKEEGSKAGGLIRNWFSSMWRIFKKDPVDEKLEQKKAEKAEQEKKQEHGMKSVMAAIEKCNDGTMRGPKAKDGQDVCPKSTRRLQGPNVVV